MGASRLCVIQHPSSHDCFIDATFAHTGSPNSIRLRFILRFIFLTATVVGQFHEPSDKFIIGINSNSAILLALLQFFTFMQAFDMRKGTMIATGKFAHCPLSARISIASIRFWCRRGATVVLAGFIFMV